MKTISTGLLIYFLAKHTLCDFFLQNQYMLRKGNHTSWILPLAAHCLVHASFTLALLLWLAPHLWYLALIEFGVHFVMDRMKASPKWFGRFNDVRRPAFWRAFGLDQFIHQLTYVWIVYQVSE